LYRFSIDRPPAEKHKKQNSRQTAILVQKVEEGVSYDDFRPLERSIRATWLHINEKLEKCNNGGPIGFLNVDVRSKRDYPGRGSRKRFPLCHVTNAKRNRVATSVGGRMGALDYQHTQRSPLRWLLVLPGAALLALAWTCRAEPTLALIVVSVAILLLLLSFCFGYLTVRDEGDRLAVRYGPLPLFRTHVDYAAISSVERSRSSILDGWGIHWIPGRGFTYNLWGFDCVRLVCGGKTIRIGTDDVDNLVDFLNNRMERIRGER
jgi:hypothetical protein